MIRISAATRTLVALLLFSSSAVAHTVLPLESFTRYDEISTMKLSPEGDCLALMTRGLGGKALIFFDLDAQREVARVRAPFGRVIHEFHWASNTRVVFTVADSASSEASPPLTGEMYGVDRDGRRQERIQDRQVRRQTSTRTISPTEEPDYLGVEIVSLLDGDDRHIVLSRTAQRRKADQSDPTPQIKRLDIFTGEETHLETIPLTAAKTIVDRAGQPRFAMAGLTAAWKAAPASEWQVFELRGYQSGTAQPQLIAHDDRSVLFTAVPEGQSNTAVFRLELAERTLTKLIDMPGMDVAELVTDAASGSVIGVRGEADKLAYRWLDPNHPVARTHEEMQQALRDRAASFVTRSANGRRTIVLARQVDALDEYVLFDAQKRSTARLARLYPPLESFTRSDDVGAMKISPDGEFVALSTMRDGVSFLSFVRLSDRQPSSSVRVPDGCVVHDFDWASNTRVIFQVARRQPGAVQTRPTIEIFAVDRDGRRQERIFARLAMPSIVSLLDRDDEHILISLMPLTEKGSAYILDAGTKPLLARLNIYDGKLEQAGEIPLASANVIVDRDDQPRFAVGTTDGRQITVAWKPTAQAPWETFELPGFRQSTVLPFTFTADNSSVLFTAIREGAKFTALFQVELAQRKVTQLIDIPGADILDTVSDFDSGIVGVRGYAERLEYRWLNPDHPAARAQQALLRAFEGNEVTFTSHSADGRRAIAFVNSDVAPGEYLLFDTQSKRADMIAPVSQSIDPQRMRPKQPVSIKARDGLLVPGYVTRPVGTGPYPLVVVARGALGGSRAERSFDKDVQLLASRGYAVLQIYARGSIGYGLDFSSAGLREMGAKVQDDITDATRWAIEQKVALPERICIYGAGFDGYSAMMGAAREPKLYRCAIGFAGVYDLTPLATYASGVRSEILDNTVDTLIGSDPEDLRGRSPINLAARIEAAVLLISSTNDRPTNAMVRALQKAGKSVEELSLDERGITSRVVYDDAKQREVFDSVMRFLDRHLMTGGE